MKNLKYLLAFPVLALAAVMGTACDDENEEPRMELPSIEVGEVDWHLKRSRKSW